MSLLVIDLPQIFHASLMSQLNGKDITLDENLFRHVILNTIRANRIKFRDYKDVVIATDSKFSWRYEEFPYYKAKRKKQRSNSGLDWKSIHESFNKIVDELRDNFPYRVLSVWRAEADDIISWICRFESDKNILILSGDKDFMQLQTIKGVKQYDPINKRFLTTEDPHSYLLEHILRGDVGDGIPNCLSDDDTFVVDGKRQVTLTKTKMAELIARIDKEKIPNYHRNFVLIDLSMTPVEVTRSIHETYRSEENKTRSKMFNYFMQHRLTNLMVNLQEF